MNPFNFYIRSKVLSFYVYSVDNITIFGSNQNERSYLSIIELYSFVDSYISTTTNAEGFFTVQNKNGYTLSAFDAQTGDYSPIYVLNDNALTDETPVLSSSSESSLDQKKDNLSFDNKEQENKKEGVLLNTGEAQKNVYNT